ncbi:MAG: c-type cytochrome [Geminicoccaceae bacterium]
MAVLSGVWLSQRQGFVPGDASDLDQVAFGARVYQNVCANCHGADLDGQLGWQEPMRDGTRLAPAHNTEGQTWRYSDETLFNVVKFGGDQFKTDGSPSRMPAFENRLTDDEIWAAIAYFKSSWPTDVLEAQQNTASTKP